MQQKTESERFFMGASMFDMAKLVTKASILEDNPDISPAEARIEFFYRWYWEDFDTSNREKILEALRLKDTRGRFSCVNRDTGEPSETTEKVR